jgi:hypothetical protein
MQEARTAGTFQDSLDLRQVRSRVARALGGLDQNLQAFIGEAAV